jgi:hypothetical protein
VAWSLRHPVAVAAVAVLLSSCTTMPHYDLRQNPHLGFPTSRLSDLTIVFLGESFRAKHVAALEHPAGMMVVSAKEDLISKPLFSVPLSPGRYEIYEWIQGGSTFACLVTRTQAVDLTWTNPETKNCSRDSRLYYLACDHRQFLIFPESLNPAVQAELSDDSRFEDAYYNGNFRSVKTKGPVRSAHLTTPGLGAPIVYVGQDASGEAVSLFLYQGE